MRKVLPESHEWKPTIGELHERKIAIRVLCTVCDGIHDVDLAALIAKVGPEYCLFNRRCRCRLTEGCNGWNRFYHNKVAVFRPFWSEERAAIWSSRNFRDRNSS